MITCHQQVLIVVRSRERRLRDSLFTAMVNSQICGNYYELASESHTAARAVARADLIDMSPANMSPALLQKYVRLKRCIAHT